MDVPIRSFDPVYVMNAGWGSMYLYARVCVLVCVDEFNVKNLLLLGILQMY